MKYLKKKFFETKIFWIGAFFDLSHVQKRLFNALKKANFIFMQNDNTKVTQKHNV